MLQLTVERNGLQQRLLKFGLGLDIAMNGLLGGHMRETLSGSAGRAKYQDGAWWGSAAVFLIDAALGRGHCWDQMVKEAARRAAEFSTVESAT